MKVRRGRLLIAVALAVSGALALGHVGVPAWSRPRPWVPPPAPWLAVLEAPPEAHAAAAAAVAELNQALSDGDLSTVKRRLEVPSLMSFLELHHRQRRSVRLVVADVHMLRDREIVFGLRAVAKGRSRQWVEAPSLVWMAHGEVSPVIRLEAVRVAMRAVAIRGEVRLDLLEHRVEATFTLDLQGTPTSIVDVEAPSGFDRGGDDSDHGLRWTEISQDGIACRSVQVGRILYVEVPRPGPRVRLRLRLAGSPRQDDGSHLAREWGARQIFIRTLTPTVARSKPTVDLAVQYRTVGDAVLLSQGGTVARSSDSAQWRQASVRRAGGERVSVLIADLARYGKLKWPGTDVEVYGSSTREVMLEEIQEKVAQAARALSVLGPLPARRLTLAFFDRVGAGIDAEVLEDVIVFGEPSASLALWTHELAHLWFGNEIPASTSRVSRWWESVAELASYWALDVQEATRVRQGRLAFYDELAEELDVPLMRPERIAGDAARSYGKGMLVLEALQAELGQDQMAAFLRALVERYRGQPIDWPELVALLGEREGRARGQWLEEWLERPGAPALELSGQLTTGAVFAGELNQNLAQGVAPYRGVVEVAMQGEDGKTLAIHRVALGGARTPLSLPVPPRAREVVLDPHVRFPRRLHVRSNDRAPRAVATHVALSASP